MDFTVDLRTVVEVIPRDTTFQELPVLSCVDCPDIQWQNKYGFVAFQLFGINVAADGLNERGLSAAWLVLNTSQYPTPQHDEVKTLKPIVTSVCSYLLGNYATVDEVRAGLETFSVAEFDDRIGGPLLGTAELGRVRLHVSVHDALGKSLVIEFINGETKVYDDVHGVLTNDPPLEEQLLGLEANGLAAFPGGYDPVSRFLRTSVLNYHAPREYKTPVSGGPLSYTSATVEQRAVSDALHIINSVMQPQFGSFATQWSVVRDHARRKLYFQSTQNMVLRMIDLNQIDFAKASSRRLIPVTFGDWFVDVTPAFTTPTKTADLSPRTQFQQLLQRSEGVVPPVATTVAVDATPETAPPPTGTCAVADGQSVGACE